MKLFYPFFILSTILIFSGCINDDISECPVEEEDNFILKFRYQSNDPNELFIEKIQQVNVFIFTQEGKFVTSLSADLEALTTFAGVTMDLDPGSYYVICWGNISAKTFISPLNVTSNIADAFLSNIATRNNTTATDGDKLYYASDNIVLSSNLKATTTNIIERILNFKNAYIKVQVYIKGFVDKNLQGQSLPPIVEMASVPGGYNFSMQTSGNDVRYLNTTSFQNISGEEISAVTFYTPRFTNNNAINVLIKKTSDGSTVNSINLKDFMKENNISIEGIEDAVVPMLIEYKQASVEIGIPEWEQNPVDPEL
ncbi:MAG: FimB/Mfa2 family fimbrial subunit [Dysgonomonas sp.]